MSELVRIAPGALEIGRPLPWNVYDAEGNILYGYNSFFQYLEGEERAVLELYQRIKADPRHRDVVTLIRKPLKKRTFRDWSMKYVPLSADVQAFLGRHQLSAFEPASFDGAQCEEMIKLIRDSREEQKLVNHDESQTVPAQKPSAVSKGVIGGVILAAVCVIGGLIATGASL